MTRKIRKNRHEKAVDAIGWDDVLCKYVCYRRIGGAEMEYNICERASVLPSWRRVECCRYKYRIAGSYRLFGCKTAATVYFEETFSGGSR